MLNFYVEQTRGFGLGNFINCTPTIKALYIKHGQRIPVYFHQEYVKQCYLDSPFIEIIKDRTGRTKLFGSDMINRRNDMRDIDFIEQNVLGSPGFQKTFIDNVAPFKEVGEFGLFINGAGNHSEAYLERKSVPFDIQELIQEHSDVQVFVPGS